MDLDIDHCRVMPFEHGYILLGDVRIPDACEIIRAASDENIQRLAVIETFATLRETYAGVEAKPRLVTDLVQSKDVGVFHLIDIGDDQRPAIVSTGDNDRIVVRNVEYLADVFPMNRSHAVVANASIVVFEILNETMHCEVTRRKTDVH